MIIEFPYNFFKTNLLYALNKPTKPKVIVYKVTNRCNMSCFMCGNYKRENNFQNELTADDIKKIFSDPYLKNLDVIRFTGGEPFIKKDLKEIIYNIHKNTKTAFYFITTNCTFIERMEDLIKNLVPEGIKLNLQVSLDTLDEGHDDIRKLKGSGKLVIENLLRLKKLQEKYHFFIGVNQTISSKNLTKVKEVNAFCRANNFVHMTLLASRYHESDEMAGFEDFSSDFDLYEPISKDDLNQFYETLEEIENETHHRSLYERLRHFTENYLHHHAKNRLLRNTISPLPKCVAYFNYLRILPDGSIIPCSLRSGLHLGNLKEQPLSQMWESQKASRYRMIIKNCQGCWVQCDIVPSIPYSMSFYTWALSNIFSFKL